jgi:hypothetical protein
VEGRQQVHDASVRRGTQRRQQTVSAVTSAAEADSTHCQAVQDSSTVLTNATLRALAAAPHAACPWLHSPSPAEKSSQQWGNT